MLQITIILWLPSLLPSWAGFEISAVVLYLSLHQNVSSVFFSNQAQGNSCFTPTTVAGRTESYRINTAHAFPAQKLSQQGNPKKRDRTTLPLQLAAEFKRFHQLVSSRKIANGGRKKFKELFGSALGNLCKSLFWSLKAMPSQGVPCFHKF